MSRSLVLVGLLSEPFATLYSYLAFILYKDLEASVFEVALLAMLKPVVTILSFYWSAGLKGRVRGLKRNVVWAGILMRAPFLLCLWIDSVGFVIGAAVNYMFFYRAQAPGWMEMIRRGLEQEKRGRAFSWSAALGYAEGVALSLGVGGMLDRDPGLWRVLFVGAALIGLLSVWVQGQITVAGVEVAGEKMSWRELTVRPWRDSWNLMRGEFARFQWGFMGCGFGIMLIQPVLTVFCVDRLGVSYLEMMAAISVAKGLGFVVSSPLWARVLERVDLLRVAGAVFLVVGLFPVLLGCSVWGLVWFYVAHFWYGVGQGGSHLVWNLSGPMFSGREESARYTGVNVVLAGCRGAVAPPLGGWLAGVTGPLGVLGLSGLLCFLSGFVLWRKKVCRESSRSL